MRVCLNHSCIKETKKVVARLTEKFIFFLSWRKIFKYLLDRNLLKFDENISEELKGKLDSYIERFGGIVHLLRLKERQGLIRAKLEGAKAATGEVIIFLDSHCEANQGW